MVGPLAKRLILGTFQGCYALERFPLYTNEHIFRINCHKSRNSLICLCA